MVDLIARARAAARHAHAPYSRFAVGAAVRLSDGSVVTGANFENASYGLSLCAETVALATVNAQGKLREVVEIAVIGGTIDGDTVRGTAIVRPCGRCRQILNEAAQLARCDIAVHSGSAEGDAVETRTVSQLLPDAFGPTDLGVG